MNLDVETEHVVMKPEWHRTIEAWVALCRHRHPGVGALDLTLRHADGRPAGEEVEAVATAGPRSLRAHATAEVMSVALGDALESLERELWASEAVEERGSLRPPRRRN
jgi:ribosome-associated translation inhibitor RaiA